jgi:hypothetical protein
VPSTTVNTPEIAENSSSPANRGQADRGWQNRGNNNRPDNRGAYSTYSTPQAGQVITPNAPSPGYNNNARPVQSAPSPSYTPRSQSQSQSSPSPSAAQVESRPAPAPAQPQATTRTTVPATTQSSQPQGRPSR